MGTKEIAEPLYFCVHVPEFPAQALLRLRPEQARSPAVVLEGEPPLEEVCSVNIRALRLGVARGMTRAELDSFEGLVVLRRSKREEENARSALLGVIGAFTPRIEVQPLVRSAFTVVLDMTGTARIFGTAAESSEAIARALSSLQLYVQMGVSANLKAAVCIAPTARSIPRIIPDGDESEHLSRLPLDALHMTPQQADTLALWGLHTLGELVSLPEVELVARLGQEGKRLRLLALGRHPHLMVPEEPAFTLEEFLAFDAPIELMESLLFVLGPMIDQLLSRAQNRAYALASITVTLGLDGGGEHTRTVQPALPVLQRDVLLKLLHLDLQAHPPHAGVMSLFVHAEPGDRSKVQLGLFAPQLPESQRLDVTLARIAALVGEESVGRAKLLDTHRSDRFAMERFAVPASAPKESKARYAVALSRCRPPLGMSVECSDRRLVAFFLYGRRYLVEEAYGPWRGSGDWWSSEVWSREEWDVRATSQGSASKDETLLCIVSHDLLSRLWQLEALYD